MTANIHEKTAFLKVESDLDILENVFFEYLNTRCWLCSDTDKQPFNPHTKNRSWKDYSNLCTFPEMKGFITANPSFRPCLIPIAAGLVAIDLDKLRSSDEDFPEWALSLAKKFGSYCEVSQSNTGIHIVLKGMSSGSRASIIHGSKIELLTNHCLTLTGAVINGFDIICEGGDEFSNFYHETFPPEEKRNAYSGPKSPPLSDADIIMLCSKAINGKKFETLFYSGDISDYGDDNSSADLALVAILGFYTQNPDQLFELFKQSALFKKPGRDEKWRRSDYRDRTIHKALSGLTSVYQHKKEPGPNATPGSWDNPVPIEMQEDLDISFPVDCLPETMRNAVLEVERSVQVNPAMAVIPALGILALQIGKKVVVVEKEGLEHHGSLFLICVMKQVERKSETSNRILNPIKDEIEKEYEEHQRENAAIEAHNTTVDEQIAAIRTLIRKGERETPIEDLKKQQEDLILSKKKFPASPQNWSDDITAQRLQQRLHMHNGAFGLFSSEGRGVIHRIMDKDDSGGSVGKSIYTAATWGDDLLRSRVGGKGEPEECSIRKPALTITLFIQEDIWSELSKDKTMRQNGTISRICVTNPQSRVGTRLEQEGEEPFNPSRIKPFTDAVIRIRKWKPEMMVYVRLSDEAKRAKRNFYNAIEKESGPGGKYEDVADIAGRACSLTAKIASNLAVCEAAERGQLIDAIPDITEEQWLRAQAIQEYFLSQSIDMQRVQGHSGNDHLVQKTAKWLQKNLKSNGPRLLLATLKNRVRGLTDDILTTQVVPSLEKAGWIRKGDRIRKGNFAYEINPKIQFLPPEPNE